MTYSQRLNLLYGLCLVETGANTETLNIDQQDVIEATNYLACYITFKAIQQAERSPADERVENFDLLSVYQTYAMLVYAYLAMPLAQENIAPDVEGSPIVIAKTLFAGLSTEELSEIIESGGHKFQLIANAQQEQWESYREDMDKTVVAFVVAGTDDHAPFDKDEVIPMLGTLLSMLCEAFSS